MRRGGRVVAFLGACWLAAGTAVAGQDVQTDPLPAVLEALEGEWEGEGVLLNRPGAFRMEWTSLGGGFVRLSYTNGWVGDDGDTIPVLSAEATYRAQGSTALGVWLDNRPQQITLDAVLTDSSVVTRWTAPAETGRTEYVLLSPTEAVVRDFVIVDGADQLFGEARYRRVGSTGR